jgi:hypothetical protein
MINNLFLNARNYCPTSGLLNYGQVIPKQDDVAI